MENFTKAVASRNARRAAARYEPTAALTGTMPLSATASIASIRAGLVSFGFSGWRMRQN